MNRLIKGFETELRSKIAQKCTQPQAEEGYLTKCFKFFDIHNKGGVSFDQFYRTIEKIGVIIEKSEAQKIFEHYDTNQNNQLDYKEFAQMFYGNPSENGSKSTASQRGGPYPDLPIYNNYKPTGAQLRSSGTPDGQDLIKLFRDKIKSRGVRGIIGLQKLFSIMDDDGSKSISLFEFSKACKDFRVGINEENVPLIFDLFDTNHDGTLNVDEFLMAIRGELNEYRHSLIERAYAVLDRDGNGFIEVEDIKERYSATRHPDVVQGRKSEEQILMDFIETFETHHNLRTGSARDNKVTFEEFLEYYANVSISIDSDEYFALMMNNSWNIKGDAATYQKQNKGWANKEDDAVSQASQRSSQVSVKEPVRRSGVASKDNPLATTTHDYYKPTATASRGNTSSQMYSKPPMTKEVEVQQNKVLHKQIVQDMPERNIYQGGYNPNANLKPVVKPDRETNIPTPQFAPKFQTILVERFREQLKSRGGRGLIGLKRQFKIMDDNGSGSLDINEFRKGIHDFQIDIDEKDIDGIFKAFDADGCGQISYDDFVRVVVGPMNQFRTQLVQKVFNKIDFSGDGVLGIEDIKGRYDPSRHPDVKSGKKSEEEVLTEFLETFEQHHNILNGYQSDGQVTLEEFVEYYTNISANIEGDAYFDLMINNSWNLDGRNNTDNLPFAGSKKKVTNVSARDAWRQDHHRNLFGTDKVTPFMKTKNQEWQTSSKGTYTESAFVPQQQLASAGGATFKNPNEYRQQLMSDSQRNSNITYAAVPNTEEDMVKLFRSKLAQRGARGILGMQRIFRIMDDNRNGQLEGPEFWKAICDFRIQISGQEARDLFDIFDINGDGTISYDELMRSVVGEMNNYRKALVKRAFEKLDRNGNGVVELDDIKGFYNAKMHPDVRSGKKTEDDVLTEFLDTFQLHHSLKNPNERDSQITFKEFIEYYNNVSASIDNDQYFELMMTNAWNLNNQTYQRGWGGQN